MHGHMNVKKSWNCVNIFIISELYFYKLNSNNQKLYKKIYKAFILGQWKQKVCLKHLFNLVTVLNGVLCICI